MKVGIVGCGVISGIYLKNLKERYTSVEVAGCTDRFMEKAQGRAEEFATRAMSYDALMHSPEIEVILNLTVPQEHASVALDALQAGKHVYGEKPFAITREEGEQVLRTAREKGLYVGCAPDMFLGAGIQTMYRAMQDGWIGDPVAATAGWSSRGHERWHANPGFYYQQGGGPILDMGPYYITALVGAFGSVRKVTGVSKRTFHERTVTAPGPLRGTRIPVEVDTHYQVILTFENGVSVNLFLSFDVWTNTFPRMEIYGTKGTLQGPDPNTLEGGVHICGMYEKEFRELPAVNPFAGNIRGLGLAQMCDAITRGTKVLASGELALHVLDVMCCIETACREERSVSCQTSTPRPDLLPMLQMEAEYGF